MPNQYGDPTPQEIMQGILDEGQQQIASAQDPAARRNAIMFAMGRQLTAGNDPRVRRAEELDNAIKGSMALKRNEGESAIDYELRKGRDLYGRVKDLDSNTAFQVAERIVTLEEEQFQKGRLIESDERAARAEERTVEMHDAQMEGMGNARAVHRMEGIRYGYNPNTRTIVPGLWAHTDDPTAQLEMGAWAEDGVTPITADQAFALGQDTSAADNAMLGSAHNAHLAAASAYVEQGILGREIVSGFADAIEASINPTASIRPMAESAQAIANSIEEVRRLSNTNADGTVDENYVPTPGVNSPEFAADTKRVADAMNQYGIKTALPASYMTLYIYAMAKAQDARVTNMDFETIAKTISAVAGNPEQTLQQIEGQLRVRRETLTRTVRGLAQKLYDSNPEGSKGRFQGETLLNVLDEGDRVFTEVQGAGGRMREVSRGRTATVTAPTGEVYNDSDFEVE
jgi:hypothetical protein